ncbi:twin-arginine translocase TatA/TatE family subunit [Methanolobus psychrotolerans]|uniref:twin-arginine translocase TatA/TatE family subunit n=1 Tax=Methanolobus psychrotolerans TaxID=1874706 RepID=UPI000B91C920|nr:twin-arginine translocase TatA/TatE family subunit [Methanolobus psychrotolerans]
MIGGFGPTELLVIFAAIFLLFGASKLPELANSMGKSMGEFRKAQRESELSLKDYENSLEHIREEEKKLKDNLKLEPIEVDTKEKHTTN